MITEHSGLFGVDFLASMNELTMQNYGNSMNYYVKVKEWDQKYVTFYREGTTSDDF